MAEEFLVSFPLFVLTRNPKFDKDGSWIVTKETQIVTGGPDGYLALFTDSDWAERYAAKLARQSKVIEISTHGAAAEFARRMKDFHSCTVVAFDPALSTSAQRVPTIPIDDFIKVCEQSSS